MNLELLNKEYSKMQLKYGAPQLDSIYNGGCSCNPDICFVYMNPTGKNIASAKTWKGLKAPWIGTKGIWDLFFNVDLMNVDIYNKIKEFKPNDWTEDFASNVYEDVTNHNFFITNLGKCTQLDARPIPNNVYLQYLELLEKEIDIIKPKVVILFGNQVSSIVLGQNISVSKSRKKLYTKNINNNEYKFYSVYYPVGNGRYNIDKSIEDIKWIIENELKKES